MTHRGNHFDPTAQVRSLVLSHLEPGAQTRKIALPDSGTAPGAVGFVIDGRTKGKAHRVLVEADATDNPAAPERIRRMAAWRNALGGDAAILYCGAGLGAEGLLRAMKQGIQIIDGEPEAGLRAHTGHSATVRHVSVTDWKLRLYSDSTESRPLLFHSGPGMDCLRYHGKPLQNWLSRASRKLLRRISEDGVLKAVYAFKRPVPIMDGRTEMAVNGLEADFNCAIRILLHSESIDLRSAEYDIGRKRFSKSRLEGAAAPIFFGEGGSAEVGYAFREGGVDWKPEHHVFHPVHGVPGLGLPDLDGVIASLDLSVESGNPTATQAHA